MRKLALALLALLALCVFAAPASADPPTHQRIPFQDTLTNPTACGAYGVTWDIDGVADVWRFTDDQGRLTKIVAHVREDNTVTNTVTGLTLREGPNNFVETSFFDPETRVRERIFIVGTSARVRRGNELLVDRGPILIDGQTGDILWSAGPHPLRELIDGSFDTSLALPGFCHILR